MLCRKNNKFYLLCFLAIVWISPQAYSQSFSDLWKKHGGTVLEKNNLKPSNEFLVPDIVIGEVTSNGDEYFISGIIKNLTSGLSLIINGAKHELLADGSFSKICLTENSHFQFQSKQIWVWKLIKMLRF